MAGPLTQFSLFDLPAPQEEPSGVQPEAAHDGPPADQPAAAAAPEEDTTQPMPATEQGGTFSYFDDADDGIPTLPQEQPAPPTPVFVQPIEPITPETVIMEPVDQVPFDEPSIVEEPSIEAYMAAPAASEAIQEAAGEIPAPPGAMPVENLPTEQAAAPQPESVASEAMTPELPSETEAPQPVLTPAVTFEPEAAQETTPAAAPDISLPAAPVPAQEPRPSRPILTFDIEPLGEADPQDIPREFLSGRPIVKEPKPKSNRGRKSLKATEAGPDKILVPEDEELFKKQYYPISEVATMFGVNISQIRYWENEFPQLKPRKNGKGDRLFRPEDIKMLVLIHDLIRRRKYTLEGAKEFLRVNNGEDLRFPLIQQLQKLKMFMNELKANL